MSIISKISNWLSGVYLWLTILIFGVTLYFLVSKKNQVESNGGLAKFKEKEVSGIVLDKYMKYKDRGATFLQLLSHGDTINLTNYYINTMLSEKLIEIDDSLVKRSGKLEFEVYKYGRTDSLIIISNEGYKIINK